MLNGKIAIVTGGTRGIGLAVVRTFLHNGAKVALFGSREASVQRALAQLREEQPDWPVIGLWPDLTDYAAVERAVQEVAQTFGGVDILVNNAGISAREPLADYSPEAFRSIMDLNVTAAARPSSRSCAQQGRAASSTPAPWSASMVSRAASAIPPANLPSTA